jgi:hypothetical protein
MRSSEVDDDVLWTAAYTEVRCESEGWANVPNEEVDRYHEVMNAIRGNKELEYAYGGILEVAYEDPM